MNFEEIDFTNAEMLRRKAEAQLKKERQKTAAKESETDVKKLLHELQVHQIELEMQNEELKQAYSTAEKALKNYTMLYDFSPLGYFTLERDGTIHELNFTGAEMLGDKRFSLVNANFKLFVSKDSLPVFNNFINNVYASDSKESCEVMLGFDMNTSCHVYIEGIVPGDDTKCLLSVVDISAFKK